MCYRSTIRSHFPAFVKLRLLNCTTLDNSPCVSTYWQKFSHNSCVLSNLRGGSQCHQTRFMSSKLLKGFEPYTYTSGRWLRNDELEREARHIHFDFEALTQKVLKTCTGATTLVNCEKKDGGFNRVFIFVADNGQRRVAKLPFTLAGPRKLTTLSEVATIRFLQSHTSIPIPKILDWSNDLTNPVGMEYIIMEHVEGIQLTQIWPQMTGEEKIRCIGAIFQKLKDVANIEFPAYGSLYPADSLESGRTTRLSEQFSIGPHCGAMYWNCHPAAPQYFHNANVNAGPWSTFEAYCDSLVDVGESRIPPNEAQQSSPRYQGSPSEHITLLRSARLVLKEMSKIPEILRASSPLLLHPDLHKRNVFVARNDPSVVTAIIDWQSASIEPAFWYSQDIPDFATRATSSNSLDQTNSELAAQTFDGCITLLQPKVAISKAMDESFFRPFRYCYRTWKDGVVAFRQELIESCKLWSELGLAGTCPYTPPTNDAMAIHQKHYKLFVVAQNLKKDLSTLLDTTSDGWMPAEQWESTSLAHREMFKNMLAAVLEQENGDNDELIKNEQDLREIWPFDL